MDETEVWTVLQRKHSPSQSRVEQSVVDFQHGLEDREEFLGSAVLLTGLQKINSSQFLPLRVRDFVNDSRLGVCQGEFL